MSDQIVEKIQKLLKLGTSDNEHEAAQAVAQAQKLMEKHNISQAMLTQLSSEEEEEETRSWEDPLYDSMGTSRSQWRGYLGQTIAKANNSDVWTSGGKIFIVGRGSDVQTVRYLFAYCEKEIDRLSKRYAGNGKGWINNYKIGCVNAIRDKLKEAKTSAREEMIAEDSNAKNAIVKLDDKSIQIRKEIDNYFNAHNMGTRTYGKQSFSEDARKLGYKDGQKINLGTTGKGLGQGHKGLLGK